MRDMLLASRPAPTPSVANPGRPLAIGFFVNWDDSSMASLKQNITSLDWVVPEWIRLSGEMDDPLVLDIDDKALEFIQQDEAGNAGPAAAAKLQERAVEFADILVRRCQHAKTQRQKLIARCLQTIDKYKFGGLTIDIEEVPDDRRRQSFSHSCGSCMPSFRKRDLILAQAVPFDNPDWNYKAYASVTDYLMLMAYDQHWSTGEAGPVAGQDWYESILKKRMAELSPGKDDRLLRQLRLQLGRTTRARPRRSRSRNRCSPRKSRSTGPTRSNSIRRRRIRTSPIPRTTGRTTRSGFSTP